MDINHFEVLKANIQASVKGTIYQLNKVNLEEFKNKVQESIESGISPVATNGRFNNYSKSYQDAIKKGRYEKYNKKLRPINLTLSGDMMRSLYVEKTDEGFLIAFKNKLAHIHTVLGAGKSRVIRKLLPQGNEYFSNAISSFLTKLVSESWLDAFNKTRSKL
jgi:hypothetical protein